MEGRGEKRNSGREDWGKTRRKKELEGKRNGLPPAPSRSKGPAAMVGADLGFCAKRRAAAVKILGLSIST